MTPAETPAASAAGGPILTTSPGFAAWLAEARCSLALTTYQAGRLMFLGLRPDGTLRGHERILEHCQGLWTDGHSLWASARAMLWRFENDVPPGMATPQGADRRFVPREARVTGAVDMHDVAFGQAAGMAAPGPVFVATAYSCLATISHRASFRPLWRPPFVSALVPEDRCHLNGLAMDAAGRPAFVTALGRSDVADGWRERRADGGVVLDVASGEIVAAGLSMPHSPRLGPDGRLWLLSSGTGEIGWLDAGAGRFEPVAFLPGYARGLAFVGAAWAVVGLSRPRGNLTFEGLPLDALLASRGAEPRCGLVVVDLATGHVVQWLRFQHSITELYDVAVLPGVRQAEAIGFRGEDIQRAVVPEA